MMQFLRVRNPISFYYLFFSSQEQNLFLCLPFPQKCHEDKGSMGSPAYFTKSFDVNKRL